MRRRDLLKAAPLLAASPLATPALAQAPKPLRFIPQANLTSLDPIWTTRSSLTITLTWSTTRCTAMTAPPDRPQMCAGHQISADGLTWTFTLRDGLVFHDNQKVLAATAPVHPALGLARFLRPASDALYQRGRCPRRLALRHSAETACPQLLFGLGARQCFVMPERVASRPGTEQLTDPTGSGPFRFLKDEWVSGARCAYSRFDGYVPRQEPPAFFAGARWRISSGSSGSCSPIRHRRRGTANG